MSETEEIFCINYDSDGTAFNHSIGCGTICNSCGKELPPHDGRLCEVAENFHLCQSCLYGALLYYKDSDHWGNVFQYEDEYYIIEVFKHKRNRRYIPKIIREKILKYGKCKHCKSSQELQIDHIMPVSKNGTNDIENLQVLCRPCNLSKGVKIG